ncbi:ATP-dependent Clp protease ATP-binding subunit CLPT2, chloroplastic-like [Mercurialis annua]|uniref:ATP-dependent Clp protease ATP-binding subunit CLPT2, chloroplastic-like n=1 Tax=Mercurialis annua TaxID=3986 RepID=UPI0021605025|nr:ATP-dependent Clp protease ATP-binding subunit CLPT2, chloroplastic-like [Mercurialis annua]
MAAHSLTNLPWKTQPKINAKPLTFQKVYSKSLISSNSFKPCSSLDPHTHFKNLSFQSSIPSFHSTRRSISATAISSLPTANPERLASAEKVPKWTWRAIKAFAMAELEARKLKYATTGTESLLLGVLIEGTSAAAKYLWKNGITLLKVREEIVKLLGKADMYYFPPEQPPLIESAQKALDWAVDHKLKSGDNEEVTTSDLVLGIWSEVDSPGYKVLATLGFNDEKAKELESLSSGPGFVDG